MYTNSMISNLLSIPTMISLPRAGSKCWSYGSRVSENNTPDFKKNFRDTLISSFYHQTYFIKTDYDIIITKQPIVSTFKSQETMAHLSDTPQMDLESMVLETIGECQY